jgi:hypothetical protein
VRCCLDAIGVRHGTELSSLGRDCLTQWERFLEPLRDEAIDLLEIGVGGGASLRTWREWFPLARLVGLEARRVTLESAIAGCTIVQGSQTDFEVLRRILLNRRFRLIIDDGSRHVDDQVQTFLTLFPWLEPASVYICATFPDHASADHSGVSWFTALGHALLDAGGGRPPGDPRLIDHVVRKATGVFLMRGCAIVTS